MFAGTCGFNGRVEGQKIGLFRKIVNDFDDFADIVGAVAKDVDDFRGGLDSFVGTIQAIGGFFHGLDTGADFFAGTISDVQQNFGGVGNALDGGDHLIDGGGGFRDAGSLNLRVLDDVLHVNAHLVHGAGDFFDGGGSLDTHFGGFIRGASDLRGAGGDLAGGIACGAHERLQAVGHAHKSIAESVALRAGNHFDAEVAFRDGHRDSGHFL